MYHVHDRGETLGPYVLKQIESMWSSGALTAEATYWNEDSNEWRSVEHILPPAQAALHPRSTPPPLPVVELSAKNNEPERHSRRMWPWIVALCVSAATLWLITVGGGIDKHLVVNGDGKKVPAPGYKWANEDDATDYSVVREVESAPASPDQRIIRDRLYQEVMSEHEKDRPSSMYVETSTLIVRYPKNPRILRCYALSLFFRGNLQSALDAVDEATAIDGDDAFGWMDQGVLLQAMKLPDSASTCFKRAKERGGQYAYVWASLGYFYAENSLDDLAIDALGHAEQLAKVKSYDDHGGEGTQAMAWRKIGDAYAKLKREEDALRAFHSLAEAWEAAGKIELARSAFFRIDAINATRKVPKEAVPATPNERHALSAPEIYGLTLPSFVSVYTEGPNGASVLGSGFLVQENTVVTNFHVIKNAQRISVRFLRDSANYPCTRVAKLDELNDLAILEVGVNGRRPLPLASDAPPEVGSDAYAVGSPEGLEGTFSKGNISGLRSFEGKELLQITSPISHGSSGGPVLNSTAQVIGISVSILERGQNLNFAIPVKYIRKLLD